ncbi:MAG: hypothetical protein A2341_15240 [Deltaproteobacteria bacterium RIFOXYB12_FULL_58_9]|nr:MAG: hypothetical protein A2341_15240 [Deltaproteobacteria bacterium RIFOXYB12_FULL_58_9]
MGERLVSLFQALFRVRPEEAKRTGMAFGYLFFAIGAFIIGRIARTVLFLEIPGYKEKLPLAYVLIAITVSITMYFYSRIERKLRRDQTNAITLVALVLGTLAFRFTLNGDGDAPKWGFYIWVEILGGFLIIQFWAFINEIFNSRQAKRVFAIIGGGGVIANIIFGLGISRAVKSLGTENLLYVLCGCLFASFIFVILLGREARPELKAAQERKAPAGTKGAKQKAPLPQKVFASRHIQLIALVIVLTYLVSTLVDYQFQVIVGEEILGGEGILAKDARSEFFGLFFGITGILGGFVQFFVTARLLERFGVAVALLLLPVFMLMGSMGVVVIGLLGPATVASAIKLFTASTTKGSEVVLRYTVNDTTLQLLYLPLPAQTRGRAKTIIDGILKPLSIGVAGLILALLVGQLEKLVGWDLGFNVGVYEIGWVVAGALALWIITLLGLRREYLKSLVQTLQRRRLNLADATFQINDQSTVQVINKALTASNVGDVLHGLELLSHVSPKMRDPLDAKAVALLSHEAEDVRVSALNYLGSAGTHPHGDQVRQLLEDPSAEVRASATLALCAIEGMGALGQVHHMLEDPDLRVRACAVAGLIRHGGLDGVMACANILKKMLDSESPDDRERAAWVLGEIGVENFYQPLIPLLEDDDERVRLAAIVASGRLKTDQLNERLVAQLDHPRLATAAVNALSAAGPQILDQIIEIFRNTQTPAGIRVQIPRIIARLENHHGAAVLCEHLQDPDPLVRTAAVQALAVMLDRVSGIRLNVDAVSNAIKSESKSYFDLLAKSLDLRFDANTSLLDDALQHRRDQVVDRLLALLGLKHPAETIDLVRRNLKSGQPTTRANAVEVLDNLLDNEEKPFVVPVVEDTTSARKLAAGAEVFSIERRDRASRLEELLESKDEWLQLCAATAIGAWKIDSLESKVQVLLESGNPVCRETALYVLHKLSSTALTAALEKLAEDPAPKVRQYTQYLVAQQSS